MPPRHPQHAASLNRERTRRFLVRAYLIAHLVAAAIVALFCLLLFGSEILDLVTGRPILDPVSFAIVMTWNVAGLLCARGTWAGAWKALRPRVASVDLGLSSVAELRPRG